MSHHLVEAREVSYRYPDGTPALHEISFRITHGECVALVGPNGAGKSTLLLHMIGFLLPATGTLQVGDVLASEGTVEELRRTVGMVFQDPDDQLFMPSVEADVAFGPSNLGLPPEQVEARTRQALQTVGMLHVRERPVHRLSMGEKRAVAIAGVIAASPAILVMDEPSSNLDPLARERLIDLLSEFEHTRLIATHDLQMARRLCPRTIILHQGRVAADGKTTDILEDHDLLVRCELARG